MPPSKHWPTCVPFVISFYDAVPVNPLIYHSHPPRRAAKNANDPKSFMSIHPPLVPSSKPLDRYYVKYGPPIDSNPHWMRIRSYMPFPSHRIRHINQGIKLKHRTLWLGYCINCTLAWVGVVQHVVVKSITRLLFN